MTVQSYKQIMEVDIAATLPVPANIGDIAYADDTARHYMYSGGGWYVITNATEIIAMLPKTYVNGTANTNQRLRWIDSTTVTGGAGNATFYVTSDRTSTGTARATAIDLDSVSLRTEDATGQYAFGAITSPNVKTLVANITKQAFTGVVVLTLTVLGSVVNNIAPNGTVVKLTLDGDAA